MNLKQEKSFNRKRSTSNIINKFLNALLCLSSTEKRSKMLFCLSSVYWAKISDTICWSHIINKFFNALLFLKDKTQGMLSVCPWRNDQKYHPKWPAFFRSIFLFYLFITAYMQWIWKKINQSTENVPVFCSTGWKCWCKSVLLTIV